MTAGRWKRSHDYNQIKHYLIKWESRFKGLSVLLLFPNHTSITGALGDSYKERLDKLELFSLEHQRLMGILIEVYKNM